MADDAGILVDGTLHGVRYLRLLAAREARRPTRAVDRRAEDFGGGLEVPVEWSARYRHIGAGYSGDVALRAMPGEALALEA